MVFSTTSKRCCAEGTAAVQAMAAIPRALANRAFMAANIPPDLRNSCRGLFPRRITPWLDAADGTVDAELSERPRDRWPADRGQRALQIGIAKPARQPVDGITHHVALRATPGARDANAVLEFAIRLHQHHTNEVLPPRHERVPRVVPAL